MTHEERISYMVIAMRVAGFTTSDYGAEMVIRLNDLVTEKQGETDLRSMCKIKSELEAKYSKGEAKD